MTISNTNDLIEQEREARVILDSSNDAYIEIDTNNIIVDWNRSAQLILGWTREQVIGKKFAEVILPSRYREAQSKELKHFHNQVNLENTISNKRLEIFALRSDGQEFPAEITVFPVSSGNSVNLGAFIRQSREWKVADHNFRRLLELAPDAMVVVNQLGNIVLVNSQTENIFGYKREEILGKAVEKLIPDHSKFLAQCHSQSFNTGLELYALRKDGTEFPVEISLSPLETEVGLLVSSVIRDITERKQFEHDLKKQKELFQIILNSLADGVIVADHLGRFLVVNKAAQQMTGIDYKEVPIDKWSEHYGFYQMDNISFYPTQDLALVQAICGKSVVDSEMHIRNAHVPNGAWLSINGAPMELGDGESKVGVIVFRDISKRKQTEQNNAQLAAIVESTSDAIIGTNLDGTIINWNESAIKMFGYSKSEVANRPDSIIIPVDHLAEEEAIVKRLMTGAESTTRHESVRQTKHGNLIPVSLTISTIKDQTGNIIGISKIARDVTDSKEAEQTRLAVAQELKRSNAELQQFAYVASHDLQEPLRGVAGCLEIIEETYKGKLDEKMDKLIRHAIDGASRMHALIDDLLSLSGVTIKDMTIKPADLSLVLDSALANLEAPIKASQAVITQDPLPVLAVDSTYCIQLFQNLISNAIKFRADRQLKIHVGAKHEEKHWLFSVSDNGIGFKQEYIDRIFLPFKRLHTREQYPGTGIGLAICKRIVERHSGKIWAESEEGKGSTFYFTISDAKENNE